MLEETRSLWKKQTGCCCCNYWFLAMTRKKNRYLHLPALLLLGINEMAQWNSLQVAAASCSGHHLCLPFWLPCQLEAFLAVGCSGTEIWHTNGGWSMWQTTLHLRHRAQSSPHMQPLQVTSKACDGCSVLTIFKLRSALQGSTGILHQFCVASCMSSLTSCLKEICVNEILIQYLRIEVITKQAPWIVFQKSRRPIKPHMDAMGCCRRKENCRIASLLAHVETYLGSHTCLQKERQIKGTATKFSFFSNYGFI